uniref:Mitochondrial import inner membrane translocase subunit n=1 Tax=Athene cunicularia TaxID=194338 RepID=A0A663MLK0_ATHCN
MVYNTLYFKCGLFLGKVGGFGFSSPVMLLRMTDKCFRKCIGKPGGALDNSEQKCIAMCMDRYMDSWNTVSRAYNSRLQRERANM